MTETPPDSATEPTKPAATAGGPVAQEVAAWLQSLRAGWTQPPIEKPLLWVFIVAVVAVGSPGNIHAQTESSNQVPMQLVEDADEVPVEPVEDVDMLTRLRWTLQLIFVPEVIAHVNPLYAYEPQSVEGQEVRLERVGPVAMVGECSVPSSGDEETWCAQYFSDVTAAYHAAYAAAADGDYYFATTYPLANVRPARRFVSRQSP